MRGERSTGIGIQVAIGLILVPSVCLAGEAGLKLFPDGRLLIANLILFMILMLPIHLLLLRPLVRVLEQREARSVGALRRAEALQAEAGELAHALEQRLGEARERAQGRRAELLSAGEAEQQQLVTAARTDAAGTLESVRASVAEEAAAARQTLQQGVRALAREAAAKVLGRPL